MGFQKLSWNVKTPEYGLWLNGIKQENTLHSNKYENDVLQDWVLTAEETSLDWTPTPVHFRYLKEEKAFMIGQLNHNRKLHGKGLLINRVGTVRIGSYLDGEFDLGSYIETKLQGQFQVGEIYSDETGKQWIKGSHYLGNGQSRAF